MASRGEVRSFAEVTTEKAEEREKLNVRRIEVSHENIEINKELQTLCMRKGI